MASRLARAASVFPVLLWAMAASAQTASPGSQRDALRTRLANSFVLADFNADFVTDAAITGFLDDAVTILIGDASGGFHKHTSLQTGRGPRSIAAADFDGDGLVDLAVGEFLAGSVRVFKGHRDGRFEPSTVVPMTPGVVAIVADDVDGDGRADLATANALDGLVVVLGNDGDGRWHQTPVARVAAPTTLVAVDVGLDGTTDLATVDADATAAFVLEADGRGAFGNPSPAAVSDVLSLADAARLSRVVAAGTDGRMTVLSGDGEIGKAGAPLREPLAVAIQNFAGDVSAGETVAFSRLAGVAKLVDAAAQDHLEADLRLTDAAGLASVPVLLPTLADVTLVGVVLPAEAVRILGVVTVAELADMLSALADFTDTEHRAALASVSRYLQAGSAMGAAREMTALVNRLEAAEAGTESARGGAELARRMINQMLLLGVSTDVADDEALACDTPLRRTIATATEVDTFRFSGIANERVHLSVSREGGTNFDPIWRLLSPSGMQVCANFSHADCQLPAAGAYVVEVRDNLANGTGTYGVHLQRLTNGRRCGGTIACNTPVTATLGTAALADSNLHSFSGVANERVHISIATHSGTSFQPFWRLVGPTGNHICGYAASHADCTLPTSGSYAIEVLDGNFDGTGTYSLHLQRLNAGKRCGGTIACNTPVTATLGTAARADTNLHSFSGVANERVHVSIATHSGTSFQPFWRLVGPTGNHVCGYAASHADCTLPASGSYAIEVLDGNFDGTGTYSVQLQRLTAGQRCGGTIACNAPVTATLGTAARADTNIHNFPGVANERVHVSIATHSGAGFQPYWRLVGPTGNHVCGYAPNHADCTLPTSGSYAIEVIDGNLDGMGTYSVHLQRLTAGRRCGGTIACDTPVTATLGTAARADTNVHNFPGVANERVHVSIATHSGTGFQPYWRLVGPTGNHVCGYAPSHADCTLPTSGSYAIEVIDGNLDGTGTYSVHLQRLTAGRRCGSPVPCNTAVTATVGTVARADSNLHGFGGITGGVVQVALMNQGGTLFNPFWRVVTSAGTTACGYSSATAQCSLSGSAPYAVEVLDGSHNGSGTYRLTISGAGCTALQTPTPASSGRVPVAANPVLDSSRTTWTRRAKPMDYLRHWSRTISTAMLDGTHGFSPFKAARANAD
jgi:hypothetical protein